MLAAAATNPLDVVKTRLQTQHLRLSAADWPAMGTPAVRAAVGKKVTTCPRTPLAYSGMVDVVAQLWREEGLRGFGRGVSARMLIHAPSVAICWTSYESMKHLLSSLRLLE